MKTRSAPATATRGGGGYAPVREKTLTCTSTIGRFLDSAAFTAPTTKTSSPRPRQRPPTRPGCAVRKGHKIVWHHNTTTAQQRQHTSYERSSASWSCLDAQSDDAFIALRLGSPGPVIIAAHSGSNSAPLMSEASSRVGRPAAAARGTRRFSPAIFTSTPASRSARASAMYGSQSPREPAHVTTTCFLLGSCTILSSTLDMSAWPGTSRSSSTLLS